MAAMPQPGPIHSPDVPAPAPLDATAAYRVLASHDARFDGRLFVGVTSTGVYCRPVCRVRLPKAQNCRFFPHAAGAEAAGFRPCLRCRPELAPGLSRADATQTLALAGAAAIDDAVARGEVPDLVAIAARLGITDRHLRRIFQRSHGVTPVEWMTTRRLLLAKRLLTDTGWRISEVAAAAGFGSLRRFNAVFAERYHLQPQALRREGRAAATGPAEASLGTQLRLPWRPPYDVAGMKAHLGARLLPGVEATGLMAPGDWGRTLGLTHQGQHLAGWVCLQFDEARQEVRAWLSPALAPALGPVMLLLRQLLDLDGDVAAVDALMGDLGGQWPADRLGLRVPGVVSGFEAAVRIVLAQQVSLGQAAVLAGRLVARYGSPLAGAPAGLSHLFPTAAQLAEADPDTLGSLGLFRQRSAAVLALARAVADGSLDLSPDAPLAATLEHLRALPGLGDWTVQMIALRALAWPDAFPASDAALLRALGTRSATAARQWAEAYRPWRAHAAQRLWTLQAGPTHRPPSLAPLPTAAL